MKSVVLASASPRRKELLELAGVDFDIFPAECEESYTAAEPAGIVMELSSQKASDIAGRLDSPGKGAQSAAAGEPRWVIGADTIVYFDGKVLGKPADKEDAVATLKLLQDQTHQVYTGVTVLYRDGQENGWKRVSFASCTDVTFYPVTDEEIRAYVATGDPMDKAGSYAIQSPWCVHVKGIRGDYNNVVGLPVAQLVYEVKAAGFPLPRIPGGMPTNDKGSTD